MATYNFGIVAFQPVNTASHVLGFTAAKASPVGSCLEVWDGPQNTDCVFAVRSNALDQAVGDLIMGNPRVPADIATTAARGFLSIRTCAGPPTGAPGDLSAGGNAGLVYDRTNHALYIWNGSWRSVAVT